MAKTRRVETNGNGSTEKAFKDIDFESFANIEDLAELRSMFGPTLTGKAIKGAADACDISVSRVALLLAVVGDGIKRLGKYTPKVSTANPKPKPEWKALPQNSLYPVVDALGLSRWTKDEPVNGEFGDLLEVLASVKVCHEDWIGRSKVVRMGPPTSRVKARMDREEAHAEIAGYAGLVGTLED